MLRLSLSAAVLLLSSFTVACTAAEPEPTSGTDSELAVVCMAMPVCDENDYDVPDESACPQDDSRCYSRTMCGKTIWCAGARTTEPPITCLAIPSCDLGDMEVASKSGCLQDDATCYARSLCGQTVWCTGTTGPTE
jgi:hypothetical protein